MYKRIIFFSIIVMLMSLLTGCKLKLFKEEVDLSSAQMVSKEEMKENTYYVKDGTKFGSIYAASTNGNTNGSNADFTKIAWFYGDEKRLPIYYKGENLCYVSEDTGSLTDIKIERYANVGYGFGIRGATYEDDFICFQPNDQNLIEGTDAYKKMKSEAKIFRIEFIDGEHVTSDMVNAAGAIAGMEKDSEHEIIGYLGTSYGKYTILADTWILQEFEMHKIDKAEDTKNGYLSIKLPDDAKSGYYCINGKGFFTYIDTEKANFEELPDMNEPYFTGDDEKFLAYSQQYAFTLDTDKKDIVVNINYDPESISDEHEITARMYAPNGDYYTFDYKSPGVYTCKIETAMAGNWTVNIIPTDLKVTDVKIEDGSVAQGKTSEVYEWDFEDDYRGIEFYSKYSGDGEVTGILVDDTGKTYNFEEKNQKDKTLSLLITYLPKGHYKATIYHNTDTKILVTAYTIAESSTETIILNDEDAIEDTETKDTEETESLENGEDNKEFSEEEIEKVTDFTIVG